MPSPFQHLPKCLKVLKGGYQRVIELEDCKEPHRFLVIPTLFLGTMFKSLSSPWIMSGYSIMDFMEVPRGMDLFVVQLFDISWLKGYTGIGNCIHVVRNNLSSSIEWIISIRSCAKIHENLSCGFSKTWLDCFKMTMGPQNIMTFWHNMLHDITGWMQKNELMNRKWQGHNYSKFIKGKHGFDKGVRRKNLKSYFWPKKY